MVTNEELMTLNEEVMTYFNILLILTLTWKEGTKSEGTLYEFS
jgi:hypothetical protein